MRHVRARRQFKAILVSLLVICLIVFFENRIEAFMPRLKGLAEAEANKALDGRLKLSIGSIDGGILNPLAFNGVGIKDASSAEVFNLLEIRNVRSSYRVWDLFFKKRTDAFLSSILSKDSHLDIDFVTKNGWLSGFARFTVKDNGSKVRGYLKFSNEEKMDFSGDISNDSFDIDLKPRSGTMKLKGTMNEAGELEIELNINHMNLYGIDIVSNAILKYNVVQSGDAAGKGHIEGVFETRSLILNYKPFLPSRAHYKISDGVLDIASLEVGDDFNVSGTVSLKRPYETNLLMTANNANLNRVFSSLNAQNLSSILSGIMNAKFKFNGPMKDLDYSGRIEMREGRVGDIDFRRLTANLKGDGPIIRIEDSRIERESGYFSLAGEIDLSKSPKGNMFEGVRISTSDTAIIWDDIDDAKFDDVRELRMSKKMSEEVSLGFKKFVADEKVDESLRQTDEVELEYRLHPQDSLKIKFGQDKEFFGLEHKDRF